LILMQTEIKTSAENKNSLVDIQKNSIITRIETHWEVTTYHNTICRACNYDAQAKPKCCHEDCSLDFSGVQGDNVFKSCNAMDGDYCKVCKHHFNMHFHVKKKPFLKSVSYDRFTSEQKKELEGLTDFEAAKKKMKDQVQAYQTQIKKELDNTKNELVYAFKQMKAVCSDFNYLSELLLSLDILDEQLEITNDLDDKTILQNLKGFFKNVLETVLSICI